MGNRRRCIFYNREGGCKNGDACPFLHQARKPRAPADDHAHDQNVSAHTSIVNAHSSDMPAHIPEGGPHSRTGRRRQNRGRGVPKPSETETAGEPQTEGIESFADASGASKPTYDTRRRPRNPKRGTGDKNAALGDQSGETPVEGKVVEGRPLERKPVERKPDEGPDSKGRKKTTPTEEVEGGRRRKRVPPAATQESRQVVVDWTPEMYTKELASLSALYSASLVSGRVKAEGEKETERAVEVEHPATGDKKTDTEKAETDEESLVYELRIAPSDPEICRLKILPEIIPVKVVVPSSYKLHGPVDTDPVKAEERAIGKVTETAGQKRPIEAMLVIEDESIDAYVRDRLSEVFEYQWKQHALAQSRPIYICLKMLDEEIITVLIEWMQRKADWNDGVWSPAEVGRLKDAMVWFRKTKPEKAKWESVSKFVKTRSPDSCAEQWAAEEEKLAALRAEEEPSSAAKNTDVDQSVAAEGETDPLRKEETDLLGKEKATARAGDTREESESEEEDDGSSFVSSAYESENEQEEPSAEEQTKALTALASKGPSLGGSGQVIGLYGCALENGGTVTIGRLKCVLSCQQCGHKTDMEVSPSRPGAVSSTSGSLECARCHLGLRYEVSGMLGVGESDVRVCRVTLRGATLSDLLPSDYLVSCFGCASHTRFPNVLTGLQKTSICRHCHKKLSIIFHRTQISGKQEVLSTFTGFQSTRQKTDKNVQRFTVGEPLPKNGTCKHYSKSFRWFRFPCCNKAYACDSCHDAVSDHPSEMATRMICGHCSREQAVTKQCACGKALTATSTTHWEGGKGCRDPTRMSRKDDKKYKLLSRQQQQKK